MDPLVSVARRSSTEERCAYCHDALGDEWDVCAGCDTRLHPECRAHAIECPTLGCRMSVLRQRWASPRMRPRPAFRRALASMAEWRESARLRPVVVEEAEDPRRVSWTGVLLALHALVSPFALVGFAAFFLVIYVPAYWVALVLRARAFADDMRGTVRTAGHIFSFEAAAAPFVALIAVALLTTAFASAFGPLVVTTLCLCAATAAVVVPSLGWFDVDR